MEDSSSQSRKPPILQPEDYDQLRGLISDIQEERISSIAHPLAARIHLEKLVERYWERKVEQQERENDQAERIPDGINEEDEESLEELRLRILQHPVYTTAPTVFRWPLSTSQLGQPEWSLADEIMANLSKQSLRASQEVPTSETQNIEQMHLTEDEDRIQPAVESQPSVIDQPSEDEFEDEVPPSLALPTISHCQDSLQFLLDSLSDRIPIGRGNGQKRMKRRDIITWRDVLKSIKNLPEPSVLPKEVVRSIEERMQAITGSATIFPGASILTNLGRETGALAKILRKQVPIPTHQSEKAFDLFPEPATVKKRSNLQKRLYDLDEDLFLCPDHFEDSLLASAPSDHSLYKRRRL